jgi:hypothetical protein
MVKRISPPSISSCSAAHGTDPDHLGLPYINGIKHLGNLVGSQLPADLYARYMPARAATR